jgi:hypothetical protein
VVPVYVDHVWADPAKLGQHVPIDPEVEGLGQGAVEATTPMADFVYRNSPDLIVPIL